jgi:FAD/FMN-containing dehydrogenase
MTLVLPAAAPGCTADLRAALAAARAEGLTVAVRAGGTAPSPRARGMELDLRELRGVQVDPIRRVAWVQGGALWRELDAATQVHGLAVTGARLPGTGVAASVLAGGSGWLERRMGLAADHLRAARLMTADGEIVSACSELLWALRGGGSAPGVVLELELGLRAAGPVVYGGTLAWPLARAAEVAGAYRALMDSAPDALCGGLWLAPGLDGRPAITVFVLYPGDPARGAEHLAPLRALAPAVDTVGETSYAGLQGLAATVWHPGLRRDVRGGRLATLSDAALAAALEAGVSPPGGVTGILLSPLGGAYARADAGGAAAGARDAGWAWRALAQWAEPAAEPAHRAWLAALSRGLAPHAPPRSDPGRAQRLAAVRRAYDPERVFADSNPRAAIDPG